jgi:hypothetical protein
MAALLDEITFRFLPEAATRINGLRIDKPRSLKTRLQEAAPP